MEIHAHPIAIGFELASEETGSGHRKKCPSDRRGKDALSSDWAKPAGMPIRRRRHLENNKR